MNRFETEETINGVAENRRRKGVSDIETDGVPEIEVLAPEENTGEAEDIDSLKAEREKIQKQAEADRDHLLRVSAEFENYRKRSQRHMEEFKKYANEVLLKELLAVVDNLERAISSSEGLSADAPDACIVEGVEMTLKEIKRVLEKFHVTSIEALGKPFDPVFHEAVMREASDTYPENTVCNVLQKGYMLHDRLLRPVMVSVAAGQ